MASATITRLKTAADVAREAEDSLLRKMLYGRSDLPKEEVDAIISALDRDQSRSHRWPFVMISTERFDDVLEWLATKSKRPSKAVRLWSKLFRHQDPSGTGEVLLSREDLAEALSMQPKHVSEIITELESLGAVSRKRRPVEGMKGPGSVRYFVNPWIGTCLPRGQRERAQAMAPALTLV